jgi:hypothetical protein
VTGEVFNAQGNGITTIPFSSAQNLLDKARLDVEQRSVFEIFKSITCDSSGNPATLTTFKMKSSATQREELIEIQFLEQGNDTYPRRLYANGDKTYYIDNSALLAACPVPVQTMTSEAYTVWASWSSDSIVFDSLTEGYISTGGLMNFPGDRLMDLELMDFDETHSANPLSSEILLFKTINSWYLQFRRFEDPSSPILWFKRDHSNQNWRLLSDETYRICDVQIFEDSGYVQDFLMLQNDDDQKKVILPVEFYYTEKVDKKPIFATFKLLMERRQTRFSTKHLTKRLRTELVSREYQRSFAYLNRLHHMEPLGDSELQILSWILTSNDSNRDGSPESCAIRAYGAFKVLVCVLVRILTF